MAIAAASHPLPVSYLKRGTSALHPDEPAAGHPPAISFTRRRPTKIRGIGKLTNNKILRTAINAYFIPRIHYFRRKELHSDSVGGNIWGPWHISSAVGAIAE